MDWVVIFVLLLGTVSLTVFALCLMTRCEPLSHLEGAPAFVAILALVLLFLGDLTHNELVNVAGLTCGSFAQILLVYRWRRQPRAPKLAERRLSLVSHASAPTAQRVDEGRR